MGSHAHNTLNSHGQFQSRLHPLHRHNIDNNANSAIQYMVQYALCVDASSVPPLVEHLFKRCRIRQTCLSDEPYSKTILPLKLACVCVCVCHPTTIAARNCSFYAGIDGLCWCACWRYAVAQMGSPVCTSLGQSKQANLMR